MLEEDEEDIIVYVICLWWLRYSEKQKREK